MRKIDEIAAVKFWLGKDWKGGNGNTEVARGELRLYDSIIARKTSGTLQITFGGHKSHTTKNRLNGVLAFAGWRIRQENYRHRLIAPDGTKYDWPRGDLVTFSYTDPKELTYEPV
ncbi:hypothetical protein DRJ16_06430 [Candidatus Woesearchaeota archaeon]|nr:MAG: hypothetical protein DRJ16_06430 [Candidatus Woesearchaeota archaeon]